MYINDVSLPPLVVAQSGQSYDVGINKNEWIEVLVDCPGITKEDGTAQQEEEKLYTYRLPAGLEVKPGDILSVPFGRQQVGGIAIRLLAQPPTNLAAENIRDVEDVIHSKFFNKAIGCC